MSDITRRGFVGAMAALFGGFLAPKVKAFALDPGALAPGAEIVTLQGVSKYLSPDDIHNPIDWKAVAVRLSEVVGSSDRLEGCPTIPCEHAVVEKASVKYGPGEYRDELSDDFVEFDRDVVSGCPEMYSGEVGKELPCGAKLILNYQHERVYLTKGREKYPDYYSRSQDSPEKKLFDRDPDFFNELFSDDKTYVYVPVIEFYERIGEQIPDRHFKTPCQDGNVFPPYCTCDSYRCSYEYEEYDCSAGCKGSFVLAAAIKDVDNTVDLTKQVAEVEQHYSDLLKATEVPDGIIVEKPKLDFRHV